MPDPTPPLDDFRRAYEASPKEWWLLDCGHHMNLFNEALDRIDEARDWAAWFAAERDYWRTEAHLYHTVAAQNYENGGLSVALVARERDEALARIAELEAAQANRAEGGVLPPCCREAHLRMVCETDCGNCNVCRFTARIEELEAQIDRVREVHDPIEAVRSPGGRSTSVCTGCGTDNGNWQAYPCPTVRALDAARGGQQ